MKPFLQLTLARETKIVVVFYTPRLVLGRSGLDPNKTISLIIVSKRTINKVSQRRRGSIRGVIITIGGHSGPLSHGALWSLDRRLEAGLFLPIVIAEWALLAGGVLQERVGGEGSITARGQLGGQAGVLLVNTDHEVVLRSDGVEHQVEVAHLVPAGVA